MIKIIYRACDIVQSVNGFNVRPFGIDKKKVIKISANSLADSIKNTDSQIYILGDRLSKETENFLTKTLNPVVITNYSETLGAAGSLLKSSELSSSFEDEDIIFFAEDDYLYDPSFFYKRLMDFINFADENFNFDWFIHPTDYPDQYTKSIDRSYIFQTKSGYWREVSSTTGSFICKNKFYKKYKNYFETCFNMNDIDGNMSKIFKKDALCFSPMPGIATHMHHGTYSNYIDWEFLIKKYLNS